MQIDINYARAYIYYLLITKIPNKKYQSVSKKTIDIIINELKEYFETVEEIELSFFTNESIKDTFKQVFYIDDEDIVLKKNPNPGKVDLSVFLLCSKVKATKQGEFIDIIYFDNILANYLEGNSDFINQLIDHDNKKIDRQIATLKSYYNYIQNAYKTYYMSQDPIMHQRYKIAQIVKRRNILLDKLSRDSIIYDSFQSLSTEECSFLDEGFCDSRLKEDSTLYNIKNNSKNKNQSQLSKPEFLLYIDNLQQKKYHDNINELLTRGVLDDYPIEKKFIEIQSIASSIISEGLFFYDNEQWLEKKKEADCDDINPSVIYEIWKESLSQEIKSILSISDDEYRNNNSLFAKNLNRTMIIKSFADLSPNISERINQYINSLPQFYHSSHQIGRSLLRDFASLGGDYDELRKKVIVKN